MNQISYDELRCALEDMAAQLRPSSRSSFVPIVKLAKDLGIEVELHIYSGDAKRDAQSDVDPINPRIILYRRGSTDGLLRLTAESEHLLKPRERFSVAHELGHILAYKHLDAAPVSDKSDRSEYWKQEGCINSFAEALLIPRWLAEQWLLNTPGDRPVSISHLRSWAYDQCRVSFEVTARALARTGTRIGFIKLEEGARVSDNSRLFAVRYSASGRELVLPNLHSFIEDPAFTGKIVGPRGIERIEVCRLGSAKCEKLDVEWQECLPTSARRLQSGVKFLGKMYWVSVRLDTYRENASTRVGVQLSLFE